jgi:hypothetical protein
LIEINSNGEMNYDVAKKYELVFGGIDEKDASCETDDVLSIELGYNEL